MPTAHHEPDRPTQDTATFWDSMYTAPERRWSGRPNATLVDLVGDLVPGTALDLGCGEGGDAIWLAERGWTVRAVDVSSAAIARASAAAEVAGVPVGRIRWEVADLTDHVARNGPEGEDHGYDLVSACFLQSPLDFPRAAVLRAAAERILPGGHLAVVSHAAQPPWAWAMHQGAPGRQHEGHERHREPQDLPSPTSERSDLGLDDPGWTVLVAEVRTRTATGPDGQVGQLEDCVILARRE